MTIHRTFFGKAALAAAGAGLCVFAALAPAQAGDAKQGAEQLAENTKVSIRFSWKLKGEYAPFYVALDKGYFSAEGLDVTLGPGAGAQGALAAVEQGQETATYSPAIFGLQAISKGLDVKVIALYHPGTPMAFISHPENPVRAPKDLEGKTLAHSVGDTASDFLPVFCKANGIDCGKIKMVQLNYKAVMAQFLANKVDVTAAYLTNDIPALKSKGVKLVVLDLTKHGLNVPGGSLIVGNKTIASDPKALRGLLKAMDLGFRDAKKDTLGAARIMKKYWDTTLADEVVAEQIKETVDAVPEYSGKPMGWIDSKIFSTSLKQIKDAGKIDSILSLDKYYTNDLNGG